MLPQGFQDHTQVVHVQPQETRPNLPDQPSTGTQQGRRFCSPCLTLNRILVIITLAAGILLAVSLLVLIAATSQTGQYASFLSKVNDAATIFASKFSSTPLTMSIWGVTTGGLIFVGGGGTLLVDYIRKKEHAPPAPHEPHPGNSNIFY